MLHADVKLKSTTLCRIYARKDLRNGKMSYPVSVTKTCINDQPADTMFVLKRGSYVVIRKDMLSWWEKRRFPKLDAAIMYVEMEDG